MNHSTPGLPVHHQLPESTQTHVHWVGDAIQPYYPLSSAYLRLLIFLPAILIPACASSSPGFLILGWPKSWFGFHKLQCKSPNELFGQPNKWHLWNTTQVWVVPSRLGNQPTWDGGWRRGGSTKLLTGLRKWGREIFVTDSYTTEGKFPYISLFVVDLFVHSKCTHK